MNHYDYKLICVDGSEALCHHGIKGMKWGVRRYQNPDGSLTDDGLLRYRNKHESSGYKFRNASSNLGGDKTSIGRYLSKKSEEHFSKSKEYAEEYSKRMLNKPITVTDELLNRYSKYWGVSKDKAKRMADYSMEHYAAATKSDVFKKYPHDFAEYGHPLFAGGYASRKLQDDIESKAVDWYNGKAIGSNCKKAYPLYEKNRDRKVLLDAVLKDLGFPVTQANRDAIEDTVFWD